MTERLRALAESATFTRFILLMIFLNAVLIGVETSRDIMEAHGPLLIGLNWVFQAIFVAEIAIRIGACGRRPLAFFRDGWNVFDFIVVALSLLPLAGPFATVARLARVLRVVRLVSVSRQLRLIVETMFLSIPSMGHVSLLLGLLLYVYGVLGFYLFGDIHPAYFGTLGRSILTAFQLLTLDGWADMQKAVLVERPWAWLYFGTFIIIAVFIVVNLFIAVVLNNLQEVQHRERAEASSHVPAAQQIAAIRRQLDALEATLAVRDRD